LFPPYEFMTADALITNFHGPQSTMLMLTSAFAGHDLTMDIYKIAVKEGYRFLCYGDALLII
jgi:S-adenosylmethionine:tRNA ribosyltransferase-isomerase